MSDKEPFIKPEIILPETTFKAIVLGFVLSALLAAANAYLGLLLGMTVSASIPAAVISMAVLRMFRKHNILENNIVQTAASSGESIAAGVIFTFPALVLMNYWTQFNYWETVTIALSGGALGILFTIPLRKALIVKEKLSFPEGVATAEVLKSGDKGTMLKFLISGSIIGAVLKFVIEGMKIWSSQFQFAAIFKSKIFFYFGTYLTPAVMAVGYIVGLNIAALVFLGGAISWYIAIPAYVWVNGVPPEVTDATAFGLGIWKSKIRYLGVGAMISGGIWAIISIRHSLRSSISQGMTSFGNNNASAAPSRTERDLPLKLILALLAIIIVAIVFIYFGEMKSIPLALVMAVLMIGGGFLFSAVAGYMAGLVGSSNNPISGVTIATILTSALILLVILGSGSPQGAASAILIGAVVCCAAAIAGDNMQDLKAGQVLGATPAKQQVMQFVGLFAGAIVIPPILNLLNAAYTIGSEKLSAPQASLMRSVAEGVFGGSLPWNFIITGVALGIVIIACDQFLARRNSSFRMPVLAVAVGMYLPLYLDTAMFMGGVIAWLANRFFRKNENNTNHGVAKSAAENAGLLFASGLITGEALLGVFLAIPIALSGNENVIRFFDFALPDVVGFGVLILCCVVLYTAIRGTYRKNVG